MFMSRTLNGPRFFTEQASFTFLPAGTVILSIISVNSGASVMAVNKKENIYILYILYMKNYIFKYMYVFLLSYAYVI